MIHHKFRFDIEPQQQERPRFSKRGSFVKVYDPIKTANYKKRLRLMGTKFAESVPKIDEKTPIHLEVTFYRQLPKSATKWQRRLVKLEKWLPVTKPDLSNYIKAFEDGLNTVLWHDDSQIVDIVAKKRFGDPRIEVELIELEQGKKDG
ncbi:hypothetical protein IV73_GL000143 [Weissella kandleri]|uniref:Holliday junction resolvase n=1 Tax=Weissella kandleri TaxID=1616 RepID=A0A0R2JK44_9LACO|nr:RusA family crossover junction endodeoxyribonuclease [Weissella kandleri]KRN75653.1 hypothetical protein IV73_GL000143 [Weissella kandleri]